MSSEIGSQNRIWIVERMASICGFVLKTICEGQIQIVIVYKCDWAK